VSLQVPLIDWGLRDYGLEPQVWGGNKECLGHEWGEWKESHDVREETIGGKSRTTDRWYGNPGRKFNGNHQKHTAGQFCRHCGAWRGSYGLEPTMDCLGWATGAPCGQCYVCHTVQVFREVRRVLRPDGTLFLNLGDSYYGGGGAHKDHHANPGLSKSASRNGVPKCIGKAVAYNDGPNRQLHPGLKPKDLCGVPWRVALALQADGWWLRSDIIWAKGNPMPESCTDRPTTAHEHIFLLTKSAKYFWDAEAVREDVSGTAHARGKKDGSPPSMDFKMQEPGVGNRNNSSFQSYMKDLPPENGRNLRNVWSIATAPFSDWFETVHQFHVERDAVSCGMKHKVSPDCPLHGGLLAQEPDEKGAHSPGQIPDRIVDISSLPISPECLCSYYQEETKKSSHFATFPPAIPERCIKAGTSEKGCCGAMVKKLKVREDLTQEERLKVEAFLSSKGWL